MFISLLCLHGRIYGGQVWEVFSFPLSLWLSFQVKWSAKVCKFAENTFFFFFKLEHKTHINQNLKCKNPFIPLAQYIYYCSPANPTWGNKKKQGHEVSNSATQKEKKKTKRQGHHTGLHVCHHSALATLGILGLQIYANNVAAGALLRFARSENKAEPKKK